MTGSGPRYVTYRRWRLRPGVPAEAVRDLLRARIAPHYRTLDPAVELDLEQLQDAAAVLAIARWPDRTSYDRATQGPAYQAWLEAYRPILDEWDRLVEFETEWFTRGLL